MRLYSLISIMHAQFGNSNLNKMFKTKLQTNVYVSSFN